MKLLLENWRKHLEDQNETYFEHMLAAWRVIWILKILEMKCLVHSFFPFFYTTAVSEKIECLEKMTKRNKE
jgi:hypothetical protein